MLSIGHQLVLVVSEPALFAEAAPAAAQEAMDALAPWTLPTANVNNICDNTRHTPWNAATQARLDAVRASWDPDGVFALRW